MTPSQRRIFAILTCVAILAAATTVLAATAVLPRAGAGLVAVVLTVLLAIGTTLLGRSVQQTRASAAVERPLPPVDTAEQNSLRKSAERFWNA